MRTNRWLGLDIGGANLKAATADGFAREVPFPLWQRPDELAAEIATLIRNAPPHCGLGVTMTGELADCYATKAEGVAAIVTAVQQAADGQPTRYYALSETLGAAWLDATGAIERWWLVAAANWHALASRCDADLLIDVGSTTTDIIPGAGRLATNDTARLIAGQLLYQGVGRTPICSLVDRLPYRGATCPAAAELFATTADVALLLGYFSESDHSATADGRPLTKPNSVARLGRMICADATQFDLDDALLVANAVCERMEQRLVAAVEQVLAASNLAPERVVISGSGAWLARAALSRLGHRDRVRNLADQIGDDACRCAPAWAVASLCDSSS